MASGSLSGGRQAGWLAGRQAGWLAGMKAGKVKELDFDYYYYYYYYYYEPNHWGLQTV